MPNQQRIDDANSMVIDQQQQISTEMCYSTSPTIPSKSACKHQYKNDFELLSAVYRELTLYLLCPRADRSLVDFHSTCVCE